MLGFILQTLYHKILVFSYLFDIAARLVWRGIIHDLSKFGTYELRGYGPSFYKLKNTSYGSKEYKALLDELRPVITHHYMYNSHHPEYYLDGINGMDLCDFVEMFCDWKAAVKNHRDGDIKKSIRHNKDRFSLSDNLVCILENSVSKGEKNAGSS